jgi:hypothetical protein
LFDARVRDIQLRLEFSHRTPGKVCFQEESVIFGQNLLLLIKGVLRNRQKFQQLYPGPLIYSKTSSLDSRSREGVQVAHNYLQWSKLFGNKVQG